MTHALTAVCLLVAAEHVWFLVLETFLWTAPIGRHTFRTTEEFATQSKGLAANQGLYNGFLAAGLVWGTLRSGAFALEIQAFFLACVAVAGIYGAFTVSGRIFYVQALPAIVGLVLAGLAWGRLAGA